MPVAEIDMSNQIHNSWTKDTVLAVGHGGLRYSVLFDVKSKSALRMFIEETSPRESKNKKDKRLQKQKGKYHNRCISLAHAYLLHIILAKNSGVLTDVQVCRDSVAKFLHNYLQNICNHKKLDISKLRIGFGVRKNNQVQKYAKDVMLGEKKANYSLGAKDVQELLELIQKFVKKEK